MLRATSCVLFALAASACAVPMPTSGALRCGDSAEHACPDGQRCQLGICTSATLNEAPLGGPCTLNTQCALFSDDPYGVCVVSQPGMPPQNLPISGYVVMNGLCARGCNLDLRVPCPASAVCVLVSQPATPGDGLCYRTCQTKQDCRLGLECQRTGTGDTKVCVPGCSQLFNCAPGFTCNTVTNTCGAP